MIHIMNKPTGPRTYNSPVRAEQKEQTRNQILAGLVKTMARGIAEVSIPAVARESGISIPTIYRYFLTKRDLINALPGYMAQQVGAPPMQPPPTLDALAAQVRTTF